MSGPSSENITGALTFYAYIAAALFLSGLICKDLVTEYFSRPREQRTQSGQVERKNGKKRDAHTQISTLAALSSISFAVLSYHMLSFLVDSFQVWACSNLLSTVSFLSIWNWSINSRLFRDFGEVICNQPRRFWWTQLTLAYSLGWNVYMTIEGVRNHIPHLWTYFFLDQILPVSFTQNLFLLAIVLQKDRQRHLTRKIGTSSVILQIGLVSAYFAVLAGAPASVGTTWFFPILLSTRALLFAPFILLRPQSPSSKAHQSASSEVGRQHDASAPAIKQLLQHEGRWAFGTICAYVAWQLSIGLISIDYSTATALSSLHDSPAVSALGYDLLIGVFSLLVSTIVQSDESLTE